MKYICTKQNDGPDGEPGVEEIFLFPNNLSYDIIGGLIGKIRNQSYGNWHRVNREIISLGTIIKDSTINKIITNHSNGIAIFAMRDLELFKKQISVDCKYIVVKVFADNDETNVEEIYIFPKEVHHDCFYEIINNQDEYREIVSAGFVGELYCHGSSETLGVRSRKEDTELLKKELSM